MDTAEQSRVSPRAAQKAGADGAFRALLVANATFEDPGLGDLVGPRHDLPLLRKALLDPASGLYDEAHIEMLFDRTQKELMVAIENFFDDAGPRDQLLFYYSGHGERDITGSLYLCARDTYRDKLMSTGIKDSGIADLMNESPAKMFVVVLDCCYSGAAFKGGALPATLEGRGKFILHSSGPAQRSKDAEQEESSPFTRHLVEAMLLGSLDGNNDGFVGPKDVYDYVLPKLTAATGQTPQLSIDHAVGEPALARALPRTVAHVVSQRSTVENPPVLELARTEVDIRDLPAHSVLDPIEIDVFNTGGGRLDWTAQSEVGWIRIEAERAFFRMFLRPSPGQNHGQVRVFDRAGGTTKIVSVTVHMLEDTGQPRLVLSEKEIDFGTVSQGADSPSRTVGLSNAGAGELSPRVASHPEWIRVRQLGDMLTALVDTSTRGRRIGEIVVESRGGDARIPVRVDVEPGPVLAVFPRVLDFGDVEVGRAAARRVKVSNAGQGLLQWEFGLSGEFFNAEREGDDLVVRLLDRPGSHVGSLWVKAGSDSKNVDVLAEIRRPPIGRQPPPTTPPEPPAVAPDLQVRCENQEWAFPRGRTVMIGREVTCNVIVTNPHVSREHASLQSDERGWVLTDLRSSQGIYSKGRRVSRVVVRGPTTVWLGAPDVGVELFLDVSPRSAVRTPTPPTRPAPPRPRPHMTRAPLEVHWGGSSRVFEDDRPVTIGRASTCDVVSKNHYVSRTHAEIRPTDHGWEVLDVGSARGVFSDGRQVDRVQVGDRTTVWLGLPGQGEHLVLSTLVTTPEPQPDAQAPVAAPPRSLRRVALWVGVAVLILLLLLLA